MRNSSSFLMRHAEEMIRDACCSGSPAACTEKLVAKYQQSPSDVQHAFVMGLIVRVAMRPQRNCHSCGATAVPGPILPSPSPVRFASAQPVHKQKCMKQDRQSRKSLAVLHWSKASFLQVTARRKSSNDRKNVQNVGYFVQARGYFTQKFGRFVQSCASRCSHVW